MIRPILPCRHSAAVLMALLLAMVWSCTGRTVRSERGEDISLQTEVHLSPQEAKIEKGKQLAMEGDYDRAAENFLDVYRDPDASPEHREASLFHLGVVHSELLNPKKDYDKALAYLEKLLSEYPKSEYRKQAESRIALIKSLRRDDDS